MDSRKSRVLPSMIAVFVADHWPHARERLKDRKIACVNYAHEHGVDDPEVAGWK